MNFKDILKTLDTLNEATKETGKGRIHKAEPGGYGRKFDTDEEGDEKKEKAPAVKRGRGRPKKGADDSGEVKKYSNAKGLQDFMIGNKPKQSKELDKLPKKKHSLKEYFTDLDKALNEAEQITIAPAQQNTQVIKQGTKTLGTVSNPQLAAQIKQSIGKGEMSLAGKEEMSEEGDYSAKKARAGKDIGKPGKAFSKIAKSAGERYGSKAAGERVAGAVLAKLRAKTNEADQPPHDSMASPLTLEAKKPDANKNGIPDYAEDGKGKNDLKKKKVDESMDHRHKAARHAGKAHALAKEGYNCRYDDVEEAKCYHEGYKEGLDECYGQMPIVGLVADSTTPAATVPGMASQAMKQPAMEDDLDEMDKGDWMKHKAKTTPGDTFKAFGQTFKDKEVTESPFAFEAWDKELNALLESKEDVSEGMSVSISKGQQGSPDSVTVSAQDQEAEALLGLIKQAGLGLFGGDEPNGYGAPQGDTPQHGGVDVVGDHDGMMALIKKVTGGEQGNADYADEEGREETCEVCGESSCGCDEGQEMVDEVESEDQMTYQVAEDNPPDSGAHDTEIEVQDTAQMNQSGAAYNPKNDVDEGAGGPEASEEPVEPMVSEESDEEEDDHAEKAGKEVAKDIEHDEGHKGKDDDKAEKAGEKVTKDIEYDDKKDKKEKVDEWANQVGKGPGKGTDASFEADIDFMMNVISGGLNKRKQTGQTTIPVVASQLNRQVSHNTVGINESVDPVAEWKKLAGI